MNSFSKHRVNINGKKLKALRKKKGLRQKDIADKAGVTLTTICKIETKQKTVKIVTIEKIAKALKVPVKALYRNKIITPIPIKGQKVVPKKAPPTKDQLLKVNVYRYRSFFKLFQAWIKKNKKAYGFLFSYQYLADILGYKAKTMVLKVALGEKYPSVTMLLQIIECMKLTAKESIYLILIYNFSKDKVNIKTQRKYIKKYKSLVKVK